MSVGTEDIADVSEVEIPEASDTPEVTESEVTPENDEKTTPDDESEGPVYYTADELAKLDPDVDTFDSKKLPPAMRKAYENLIQKKSTRLSEEQRKLEETRKQIEDKAAPKQRTIYDDYLDNPLGVSSYIDSEIAQARAAGDYDRVEQLRDLKLNTIAYGQNHFASQAAHDVSNARMLSELKSSIQDYDNKMPMVKNTAMTDFGLTDEDMNTILHPDNGALSIKMAKILERMHDIKAATKTMKAKVKAKTPNEVTKPGTGNRGASSANATLDALRAKAQSSGRTEDLVEYQYAREQERNRKG